MLDPTDAALSRALVGDQTTTGDPSAGAYGQPPVHIESECPPDQFETLLSADVAAAAVTPVRSAYPPAFWLVTVEPIASAEVAVYFGSGVAGLPVRLFAGWSARLPGRANTDLTIVGVGPAAHVNVIAVRGYDVWIAGGA